MYNLTFLVIIYFKFSAIKPLAHVLAFTHEWKKVKSGDQSEREKNDIHLLHLFYLQLQNTDPGYNNNKMIIIIINNKCT